MIDENFCEFLEYEICKVLQSLDQPTDFWCDGVLKSQSDYSYSKKFVNDNRKMTFKAFIGKDGQQEYELTLKFGSKALSRFARNLDIKECLSNPRHPDWVNIDIERKIIVIQLT